ncbi:MAG: hypothetical protein IKI35_05360 [Stomatobaculum sp.]|nr:hypothetical protein [Stomatobaculum sp.]
MIQFLRKHSLMLSLAFCLAWTGLFASMTGSVSTSRSAEQEKALNTALERCITNCYALEGFFPPDLQYMEEHYGLSYDKSQFFVDYQPVAANIRPDYFVLLLKEDSK